MHKAYPTSKLLEAGKNTSYPQLTLGNYFWESDFASQVSELIVTEYVSTEINKPD